MQTFTKLKNRFAKITSDNSTENLEFGGLLINETHKHICGNDDWWFNEKTKAYTTTADQREFQLPSDFRKAISVNIQNSDRKYNLNEIASKREFDRITRGAEDVTSDLPGIYHIRNDKFYIYPGTSSAGLTMTLEYLSGTRDLSFEDHSTGVVSAVAAGGTTITGASSPAWTTSMIGKYIRINSNGDWYQIATVPGATSITITKPYEGAALSAATEAYTIADLPLIPEAYQDLLWMRPVAMYYMMKEDERKSVTYIQLFEDLYRKLKMEVRSRSTQYVKNFTSNYPMINANYPPTNMT